MNGTGTLSRAHRRPTDRTVLIAARQSNAQRGNVKFEGERGRNREPLARNADVAERGATVMDCLLP
jgi:hypothetical protein